MVRHDASTESQRAEPSPRSFQPNEPTAVLWRPLAIVGAGTDFARSLASDMPQIRIGTSGWIYRHWRGDFYPRNLPVRLWFEHYQRHFDTVEINNTFYRLPPAETFEAWRQQADDGFLYAVKASRFLTHMKKLQDPAEPLERLVSRAGRLKKHLGVV